MKLVYGSIALFGGYFLGDPGLRQHDRAAEPHNIQERKNR